MTIRCAIVDDEPLALTVLENYIAQVPSLQLVEKFTNPVKALEFLNEHPVDLLFLDIQMPDLLGFDLIAQLDEKPLFIFTTAYGEHALDAFKVDAIGYLLKPIDSVDFKRVVEKAMGWIESKLDKALKMKSNKDFLFIKSEHKIIRIDFNDIKYIQGMSEYVQIHKVSGRPIMSLLSLKLLESELPEEMFMRVHKSYIVNLKKINIIERNSIINDDGSVIPVSPQYKARFQEFVDKNFIL